MHDPGRAELLLERDRELESLRAALGDAAGGDGRLALVEGPAGIGKSRLLSELRSAAEEEDVRVLAARGSELEREQYGEVLGQAEAVSEAMTPWDSGTRYLNFEEDVVDARLFYDEDTWRLLRALRTEWDPTGLFLANHEIKES